MTNVLAALCLALFCLLFNNLNALAQKPTTGPTAVKTYIEKYKGIAVTEMQRSGVPASITLAQGILESQMGNSNIALNANNHFGIKCHRSWQGPRIYAKDEKPKECFRKYASDYESFVDHTNFLQRNDRYSFLFERQQIDYRNWAKGLKKAGYATDNRYASYLIDIVEKYDLYEFDIFMKEGDQCEEVVMGMMADFRGAKIIMFNCDIALDYVTKRYGLAPELLKDWNDLVDEDIIPANSMIFIESPAKIQRLSPTQPTYKNRPDGLGDIAQLYGINTPSVFYGTSPAQPQQTYYAQVRPAKKQQPNYKKQLSQNQEIYTGNYTVQSGDTLFSLSKRFNIPLHEIKQINNLRSNTIVVGQNLVL